MPFPRFTPMLAISVILSAAMMVAGCDNAGAEFVTPNTTPAPLSIRNQSPPNGTENTVYSWVFSAQGGVGPYQWTETGPSIPGLLLNQSLGILSGTPSTPGTTQYQVQVTDSQVPPRTATATFAIVINQAGGGGPIPTNAPPQFTTIPSNLVTQTGQVYSFTFAAADVNGDPFTFAIVDQPTGGGATMNAVTGVFSWTPPADGIYCVKVQVTDSINPPTPYGFAIEASQTGTGPNPAQPARITTPPVQNAKQGVQYTYNPAVNAGAGTVIWSLLAAPPAGTLPGSTMQINPATGRVTWTPDGSHVTTPPAAPHTVTIQANNNSCTPTTQTFTIAVTPGSLPPSDIRVVVSGVSGASAVQSFNRSVSTIDPNIPDVPNTVTGAAGQFRNSSVRLAMTGPKHSLRMGAGEPREVNLNSSSVYIQCPQYPATDPATMTPGSVASCRLYHFTDAETAGAPTGSSDQIMAVDTFGTVQLYAFGVNIHEEIYVPSNFASHPRFVVTGDDGKGMWLCRVDRVNYTGGLTTTGRMLTVDLSALTATEVVMHTTVTLAGQDYWFAVRDIISGAGRIFRVPTDGTAGADPVAVTVSVPGMPATALISQYFARSGNGNRAAFVAGSNMADGITHATPDTALVGLWRDIWVIDGPSRTITRATNFQNNRPTVGPDIRLIEVFDSSPGTYGALADFAAANSNDAGGHDNRTIFGFTTTEGNTTHVGHTINFDGTLVACVVIESNAGSGDGAPTAFGLRDEVYVAGVDTAGATAGHDVIRVTAANPVPALPATNPGGRIATGNHFELNMGTVTGLMFPARSSNAGKDRRLFFTYGRASGPTGVLREFGQHMFAAEFTVSGTSPITHVSTMNRNDPTPPAAGGWDGPDPVSGLSMYVGTYESAAGHLIVMYLQGSSGAPVAGAATEWCYVNMNIANAAVAPAVGTIAPYKDPAGAAIQAMRLDDSRTFWGSGFQGNAPFGQGSAAPQVATLASMSACIPGPATIGDIEGLSFITCRTGTNENVYLISLSDPVTTPVLNITGLTAAGRVNYINPSADGLSVGIHYGTSTVPAPDVYSGTTVLDDTVVIVPSVATHATAALGGTPLTAPSIVPPGGSYVSVSGQMVNTTSLGVGGQPSYDYWYAVGSTNTTTAAPESTLTLVRVLVDPIGNTIGVQTNVSAALTQGAVVIYGSGN